MTATTEIVLKAPAYDRFNNILAGARQHKVKGWWEGSAYRNHPCGVIANGIILANQWNTNGYCYAEVILDPSAPIVWGCKDSLSSGDPYPHPKFGGTLRVYSTGSWSKDDGPWRQIIIDILDGLEIEIAASVARQKREYDAQCVAAAERHAATVAAATAALTKQFLAVEVAS